MSNIFGANHGGAVRRIDDFWFVQIAFSPLFAVKSIF